MKTLQMLIRRELWEHRPLWLIPLVVAAITLILPFLPYSHIEMTGIDAPTAFFWGLTLLQFAVASVLIFYYLIDCLYAERKDRSILFWKSLPVSDELTVLSKLIVALIVVPFGVYALGALTSLLASLFLRWGAGAWAGAQVQMLADLLVVVLWYVPVAAYLLLISAWARRNVLLWVVLPLVLVPLVEWIALHTTHSADLLSYRLFDMTAPLVFGGGSAPPPGRIHLLRALSNVDLWLGCVLAAAFVWATIRIRRHQDDS